ncbi:hypothetical protein TGDOM2_307060A, partial [Toxoplasma gondii GAB2-2007-GAL-DOM2]
MGWCVLSARG